MPRLDGRHEVALAEPAHLDLAAVERETAGVRPRLCRPSILDRYLPFIRDTLAQYPNLRATRIYEMVRQRGYPGSVIQVRRPVDCDERDV